MLVAMANADRAHDMGWLRLESLRQALREGGDDPALAVGAFNVFLDGRQRVTLYDEVEEVLQRWKSRYKLLVVTNGNADIGRIGIGHYFRCERRRARTGRRQAGPAHLRARLRPGRRRAVACAACR